jgi:3-methyl-2-oxobutanoate hydroxymethyltransferase
VIGDALGMFEAFTPKFAKKYADLAGIATDAFTEYIREVREGSFPAPEHKYRISGSLEEFNGLFKEMEMEFNK